MKRHVEDWLKERSRGEHAWSMDPYDKKTVDKVKDAAALVKADGIQTVLWIGIGGDALGPQVMKDVFEVPDTGRIAIIADPTGAALGIMTPASRG
jgi:glucose-6-phosphate isomerase